MRKRKQKRGRMFCTDGVVRRHARMAQVLARFPDLIMSHEGVRYRAQACGAPMPDGLWGGWIEFVPLDGGAPVRSAQETTQPNKGDTVFWAAGLTAIYLEDALERALTPLVRRMAVPAYPMFDAPAADSITTVEVRPLEHAAALNPFSVYERGEAVLRKELGALSAWQLVNIIVTHRLSDEPVAVLNRLPALMVIDLIVIGVRDHAMAR
jgi:hypothetical protein